jgi:putative Mg2+ transporter-C (MgtC) family protein
MCGNGSMRRNRDANMNDDVEFILRMMLAALLCFSVGWERETRGSPAGDRTYALIGLGAAAFTAIGIESFPATAEKLMAGIVTGVGFLGAGMILKEGRDVIGLTTAASIWAVAAIGVVIGTGEYFMGISLCVLILVVLELDRIPGVSRFEASNVLRRRASATPPNDT